MICFNVVLDYISDEKARQESVKEMERAATSFDELDTNNDGL